MLEEKEKDEKILKVKIGQKKIKILIGIPSASDFLHRKFVQSLMQLRYPLFSDININIVTGHQLPFARNRIVQHALEEKADFIFFIDSDMIFPSDSLIRLYNRKVNVCHALSFRRTKPYYPCIFEWSDKDKCYSTVDYSKSSSDMISVDAAGSACTLINTEVYQKMKQPYYYYQNHLFSSDLTFSMNLKKLGYDIWIDRTLKTGHIGEQLVATEESYLSSLKTESREEWYKNMKKFLKDKELYNEK